MRLWLRYDDGDVQERKVRDVWRLEFAVLRIEGPVVRDGEGFAHEIRFL